MGKQWEKYMNKMWWNKWYKVKDAVRGILSSNLTNLDIKKLVGKNNLRRCRVGDIRIIFQQTDAWSYEIVAIKPRGDVY